MICNSQIKQIKKMEDVVETIKFHYKQQKLPIIFILLLINNNLN